MRAVIDQRLNFCEDVAGAAVLFLPRRARYRRCRLLQPTEMDAAGVHVIAGKWAVEGENFEGPAVLPAPRGCGRRAPAA